MSSFQEEVEKLRGSRSELPFAIGAAKGTATTRKVARLRVRRRLFSIFLVFVGLGLAFAGIWLTVLPPSIPGYLLNNKVVVGGAVLDKESNGVYVGDGVLVIVSKGNGQETVGGSAEMGGEQAEGNCTLTTFEQVLINKCNFNWGGRTFSSVDTFDLREDTAWSRVYSDGLQVDITVPNTASIIPIPFPVGESL